MFSIAQKYTLATCTAEVTRLEPEGRGVELEFHGTQWWFPYRTWLTTAEARERLTPAAPARP